MRFTREQLLQLKEVNMPPVLSFFCFVLFYVCSNKVLCSGLNIRLVIHHFACAG